MTNKELKAMTYNICCTAERYAKLKNTNMDRANIVFSQLMGKIALAASMGVQFTVTETVLNDRDCSINGLYTTFKPGIYIEVTRADGFRDLTPVKTEVTI